MTDKSAREIVADWLLDHDVDPPRGKSINGQADAILAALEAGGFAVVPKEPTEAMFKAALLRTDTGTMDANEVWSTMLAASNPKEEGK